MASAIERAKKLLRRRTVKVEIDPAVRDRLFERFARGDSSRERRTG